MNYEQSHRRLIAGQRRGPGAFLLRALLRIASFGYSIVVRLRNFLYARGWLPVRRVDAAVICIGNITVGGTGKTPLVVWLCRQVGRNYRCAILTRGYKSAQNRGDEPAMLAESCPQAHVIVNPDRVAGAAEAIGKFDAETLIMDDGFQHRQLARDLDIVAIDATQPFGYGKMLPAGLLREPVNSLKRAGAVVLTRCDQVDEVQLAGLEEKLRALNPAMVVAKSEHAAAFIECLDGPVDPEDAGNQKRRDAVDSRLRRNDNVGSLGGKKVFAFCGVGNPEAFFNTVRTLGAELVGSKVFDDHHNYTDACLDEICRRAGDLGAELILTTQKDWTKLASEFKSQILNCGSSAPFACLGIEIRFSSGEVELKSLIESTLAGRIPRE